MRRESAEIVLTSVAPLAPRPTLLAASTLLLPPYRWPLGRAARLERAEASADGRVFRLSVRPARLGAVLRITGRGAAEPEVLAPFAARMRRALQLDRVPAADRVLCGTSLWEDLASALVLQEAGAPGAADALTGLLTLGVPCPSARSLRTFPPPGAVAAVPVRVLARLTGLASATALRALALHLAAPGAAAALDRRLDTAALPLVRRQLRRFGLTQPQALAWVLARLGRAPVSPAAAGPTRRASRGPGPRTLRPRPRALQTRRRR
jgi:hypothetical protein